MENPCIQCDDREKYDSFLEQNAPQTADLKKPSDSPLLQQTLQQYQQDHLKYKHLIENAPDAIFVADAETGVILEANHKAAELLGIPLDRVIGMHHSKLHPSEEVEKYQAIFQEHIQNKSSRIFENIYVQRKDGQKVPVRISASVTQLGPQKVIYGIFRDITEQQQNQQQLKAVFESSQDSVVVVDQNYTNLYINQSALDQVNVTPEQGGIGKTTRDGLGHMPDFMNLWIERIDEVFRTGKPMRVQDDISIGDRQVHSESVLSPIRYPGGEMFAVGIVSRDVTEQKISQERFKRLSQATFEGIIFHDNGEFVDSNQQFADMLGYSLDEISKLDGFDLFSPESHKVVKEKIASGDKGPYEATCLRKDGSTVPVEIRARTIQLEGKKTRVAAIRDMTEQKRNEAQLKASEERFKLLSEATFEGVCIHDKGLIVDVNLRFLEMHGCGSVDEIRGMDCFNLIAPQSHETVRQYITTGEEGPYEAFGMKMDGTAFPVQVRAREFQWDGKTARIATFRDLTEQKQLQQQLKESERLYKDLYRNAKVALYRTRTHDGKLLACSTVLAKIHGYDSIEDCIENHHGTDHYVDKDRRKQLLNKLSKDKRVENFEYLIRRPDEKTVWLSLTAEIFPENGWIEGVITDVTASKILTQTEMKILKIILSGKSNKEIAYGLDRSTRTIEDHRAHIMHKFGVDNIVDLTRKALQYGITPDGE